MPGFLRKATASQSRALGPFVDDTDFKTAKTGLTIANTDVKLIVNGGASANKNSGGGTHRANGLYGLTFDATDTGTVGQLEVSCLVAGALLVFDTFTVVEAAVYDALYASGAIGYVANQPVDVNTIKTQTVTAAAGVTFPTSIASPTNITAAAGIAVSSIGAGVITAASIAADAITDAKVASDVTIASVTGSVGSVTGNVGGNVTGSVGSVTGLTASNLDATVSSRMASASYTAPPSAATISGAVWDISLAAHLTAGTTGAALNGAIAPTAAVVADAVWDEILSSHVVVGSAGAALAAAGSAGDPWSTPLPGAYATGTAGKIIGSFSSQLGAGAIAWPYTITNSITGLPVADADVWVSSDLAGLNVIASGRTNQSGVVTFMLDAGTVYAWAQKSGINFSNPNSQVVS